MWGEVRLSSPEPGDEAVGHEARRRKRGEKGDWLAAIYDLGSRLDHACPLPLMVSDDWDPIRDAIEEVYGVEYLPVHYGRGRPYSKGRFAPRPDLKYAQVVKVRDSHGHLERIERRMIHGDPVAIRASLILSGMRSVNTSHVERQNLSMRNAAKRFVRETICFSKEESYLGAYLEVLQAWYNFVQPNRGLTIKTRDGAHIHRTPAMAQGLTNRPVSWEEILRWRRNLWSQDTTKNHFKDK